MNRVYMIWGAQAIHLAKLHSLTLFCHGNPENSFSAVNEEKAREVCRQDPNKIYVIVRPCGWIGDGIGKVVDDYFANGLYLGADYDDVEPRWTDAITTRP